MHKATITNILPEDENTGRFLIEVMGSSYPFLPGQYVIISIPGTDIRSAFSIASLPNANSLELLIANTGTPITDILFAPSSIGQKIQLSDAAGEVTLPEPINKDLCFICTGTGVAPFRSMIKHIFIKKLSFKNITLIHGGRNEEQLFFSKEFEALSQQHDTFSYLPVLSDSSSSWEGAKGYVHDIYQGLYNDLVPALFYLCGKKEMIRETVQYLIKKGYREEDLRYERY